MKTTSLITFVGPALLLGGITVNAIWGDNGWYAQERIHQQLDSTNEVLAELERENQGLLRELVIMERDPVVVERIVADELGWGAPNATLYRFDD